MFVRRDMNVTIKKKSPWKEEEIETLRWKYHIAGKPNWIVHPSKKDECGNYVLDENGDYQDDTTTIYFHRPGGYDQKEQYEQEYIELSKNATVIVEYKNFDWDDDSKNFGGIQVFKNGELVSDERRIFPDWRYESNPSSWWEV